MGKPRKTFRKKIHHYDFEWYLILALLAFIAYELITLDYSETFGV